jgi:tRNA-methyltransferase O
VRFDAKRPRDDPRWPEVGVLAHRHARRLNALGVSRCRLIRVDGLELHAEDLDAIDGSPVLEVKPWFTAMGPQGESAGQAGRATCSGATTPHRAQACLRSSMTACSVSVTNASVRSLVSPRSLSSPLPASCSSRASKMCSVPT